MNYNGIMKNLKRNVTLSCVALLLVVGGAYAYTANQPHHEGASKSTLIQKTVNVAMLDSNVVESNPTSPVENGQVSDEFVDRFDNAVTLNNETGQFEIDKSVLPDNASAEELSALNKLVAESNQSLKKIIAVAPKQDTVQTDDSVIVANDSKTAQAVAQDTQLTTMATHHYGSTYLHVYWYGLRIGLNKSDAQLAFGAGMVIGGVYVPVRAIQAVFGILGLTASRLIPGGIVFNSSPQFTAIMGVHAIIWGVNGNENKGL